MSIIVMENLIKLVQVNTERLKNNESSLCKTEDQTLVRDSLPCAQLDKNNINIILCEDCGFHNVENGLLLEDGLKDVLAKYRMKQMILGKTD